MISAANTFPGANIPRNVLEDWVRPLPGGELFVSQAQNYRGQDVVEIKGNADSVAASSGKIASRNGKVAIFNAVAAFGLAVEAGHLANTMSNHPAAAIIVAVAAAANMVSLAANMMVSLHHDAKAQTARHVSADLVKYADFIHNHGGG